MVRIYVFETKLPISLSKWRPKSAAAEVRDWMIKPKNKKLNPKMKNK